MIRLLFLLSLSLYLSFSAPAQDKQDKIPVTAAETEEIRKLELSYDRARAERAEALITAMRAESAMKEIETALDSKLKELSGKYKCVDCRWDDSIAAFVKPKTKEGDKLKKGETP